MGQQPSIFNYTMFRWISKVYNSIYKMKDLKLWFFIITKNKIHPNFARANLSIKEKNPPKQRKEKYIMMMQKVQQPLDDITVDNNGNSG